MSSNKRGLMRSLLTSSNGVGGCGRCAKPKPSEVHQPTPKPKISLHNYQQHTNPRTSLTSTTDTHHHKAAQNVRVLKPSPKLIDSIAVEKESKDPYKDFGQSMLQMILERDIFSESELRELLQCFLELNSPCHHRVIVQAFIHICHQTFPRKSSSAGRDGAANTEPSCGNQ